MEQDMVHREKCLQRLALLLGATTTRMIEERSACYFKGACGDVIAVVHGEPGAWLLATADRKYAVPSSAETFEAALAYFCEQVR
jgi:hypothetical protein